MWRNKIEALTSAELLVRKYVANSLKLLNPACLFNSVMLSFMFNDILR